VKTIADLDKGAMSPSAQFCHRFGLPSKTLDLCKEYRASIRKMLTDTLDATFKENTMAVLFETEMSRLREQRGMQPPTEEERMNLLMKALLSIIFAARFNTVFTASWSLIRLLFAKDIAARIREELSLLEYDEEGYFKYDSIKKMVFFEATFKEIMRLHSAPITVRKTLQPVAFGNCRVPTGSVVVVGMARHHLDPTEYSNPDNFQPERFIEKPNHGIKYIPWGYGAHKCPGSTYATMVIKSCLIVLLTKYRVEMNDPNQAFPEMYFGHSSGALPPKGEFLIKVTKL